MTGQVIFLPGVYTISEEEWQANEDRQEELSIAHAEFKYLYRDASPEEFKLRKEMVHLQARQAITLVKK